MNKNGFTLVELLAVIVILTLLALVAGTAITKVVSDSKEELSSTQIKLIKSAAEIWGADNINLLPAKNTCKYLTLGDLKNYGILESSIKDPKTDQEISNDLKIKITNTENANGIDYITYDVNVSVTGCTSVY